MTTLPRSGLSFLLSSEHCNDNLARLRASSTGQSRTAGSSISAKVPASIALSTIRTFQQLMSFDHGALLVPVWSGVEKEGRSKFQQQFETFVAKKVVEFYQSQIGSLLSFHLTYAHILSNHTRDMLLEEAPYEDALCSLILQPGIK
nr:hypothetical protein VIGAN_01038700 [Ipomoea batatas]GMD26521.1 hypothetical protein VIGAN_01038700 [Ipomoea batatas]